MFFGWRLWVIQRKLRGECHAFWKHFHAKWLLKRCVFHLKHILVTWEFTSAKTLIFLRVLNAGDFTLISFTRMFYFYFLCSMEQCSQTGRRVSLGPGSLSQERILIISEEPNLSNSLTSFSESVHLLEWPAWVWAIMLCSFSGSHRQL